MSTKTPAKVDVRIALILIGILGIASLIVSVKDTPHRVKLPPANDLEENITLSIVFHPSPRHGQGIEVQAHVEDITVTPPRTMISSSPWNQVVRIRKGARVILYAYQVGKGDLDCLITRNGVTMDHNHRADPGSIRCYLNRRDN